MLYQTVAATNLSPLCGLMNAWSNQFCYQTVATTRLDECLVQSILLPNLAISIAELFNFPNIWAKKKWTQASKLYCISIVYLMSKKNKWTFALKSKK